MNVNNPYIQKGEKPSIVENKIRHTSEPPPRMRSKTAEDTPNPSPDKSPYDYTDSKSQVSSNIRLNAIKADRRSIDRDALLLENRVLQLQRVESKMLKKIEKTRQDADKIL